MKTTLIRPESAQKRWYIVDATNLVLGRLAAELAMFLRGKRRADFTPSTDVGDFVIVVNAAKMRLTGAKVSQKSLKRYSGYPGGLKLIPYWKLMAERPEEVLRHAVRGMLPHNVLGRKQLSCLKIYGGSEHPHAAQQPKPLAMKKGNLARA